MNSTTPEVVGAAWEKLEAAFPQPNPLHAHGKLPPNVVYPKGQALGFHVASGQWRAPGAGVGPRRRLLLYPCATDASGYATYGPTVLARDKRESVPMAVAGCYFVKDITGIPDDAAVAELGQSNGYAFDNPLATVTLLSGA